MRHFTEKAGFRASILARMRALQPALTRCSWTKGVAPVVRLLFAKIAGMVMNVQGKGLPV
jgi:hypothetical protein